MNVAIILASVFFVCIFGADDLTKICQPDAYQTNIYTPNIDDAGVFAIDFTKGLLAIQYQRSMHLIFNLTDGTAVSINNTDGFCTHLPVFAAINHLAAQCLPDSAVRLGNVSRIGLNPGGVEFQAYELNYNGAYSRVVLTTTPPIVPVLRETRNGPFFEILFYTNQVTTITAQGIFTKPTACTSSS